MSDSFFSRWSQRKAEVRSGRPVADPPPPVQPPLAPTPAPTPAPRSAPPSAPLQGGGAVPTGLSAGTATPQAEPRAPAPPPPTLAEAQALTPDADFTRFVRQGVPAEVKNTAFKKLFADPHFNVMDGLDIYIDDYGRPDPLPVALARQLASAQFMGLFDETPEAGRDKLSAPGMAQSSSVPVTDPPPHETPLTETQRQDASGADPTPPATQPPHHDHAHAHAHAHADLQLQPDPALGRPGPGRGAG